MSEDRALSSVADVSVALVVVLACVVVFVSFLDAGESEYDPAAADHTAETLGASTLNVTYSLEPVLENGSEHVPAVDDERAPYDSADLQRSTHGSTLGHVGRAALAAAGFPTEQGVTYPLAVGTGYAETLDERLVVSLVGSNFATNVTAVWEPFEGASVRGIARFGEPIPHDVERSVVRTTTASELPAAQEDAVAAVESVHNTTDGNESGEKYAAVARAVADAIVNGTLGDTQRELETSGVERAVIVSRYLRFADAVEGVTRGSIHEKLARPRADAAALTARLADGLARQLAAELADTFESPHEAAAAVSTGEVTIAVTTWER